MAETQKLFNTEEDNNDSSTKEVPYYQTEENEFVVGTKKYKDVDELLKSRFEADKHIDTILKEKRELERKFHNYEGELETYKRLVDKLGHRSRSREVDYDDIEDDDNDAPDMFVDKKRNNRPKDTQTVDIDAKVDEKLRPLQERFEQYRTEAEFKDAMLDVFKTKAEASRAFEAYQQNPAVSAEVFNSMSPKERARIVKAFTASNDAKDDVTFSGQHGSRPLNSKRKSFDFDKFRQDLKRGKLTPQQIQEANEYVERHGIS